MPELNFDILSAEIKPYAAAPTLIFKLKITNEIENEEVYAAGLKTQVRIDAMHRKYEQETKARLREVFGTPERWGQTLKSLYWKQITVPVPRFTGQTVVDIPLECSEDISAAAGKYMHAVEEGPVPLAFIFNGSIFYNGHEKNVQVKQLPWDKEAVYALPIEVWDNLLDSYFPDSKWLRVPNKIFDKLNTYKAKNAHPTLNYCLETLVNDALENDRAIEKKKDEVTDGR
jgi:hypothetical protein